MSYLNEFVKNFEVQWVVLGKVAQLKRGKTITKKNKKDGDIPVISGGQKPAYYNADYNRDGETITVAGSGAYAGHVMYWNEKIFVSDAFSVIPEPSKLVLRYVYHLLLNKQSWIYKLQKGVGVPHVYPKDLAKLEIPIPCPDNPERSIKIQKEIVRVLDTFTKLTEGLNAELTTELTARKKQYEYYREQLLTFDENIGFDSLENLAENLNSKRKPIASGLRESGDIPYYGASGIVDYVKNYIFDGDYLLISEDGANLLARKTPIAFSISGKSWVNNHAHILKFETYVERRFVEYYLNSIDLTPYISGAAQPKLNKRNLNSIKIPDPSFNDKQRIVDILDKFDVLTTSISEGLPKEIELRQKQYEYYRNKLLTFPKDTVEV